MLRKRIGDLPDFLYESELITSLKEEGSEDDDVIDIPANSYKENTSIFSFKDFIQLTNTVNYFGTFLPRSIFLYAWGNKKEIFDYFYDVQRDNPFFIYFMDKILNPQHELNIEFSNNRNKTVDVTIKFKYEGSYISSWLRTFSHTQDLEELFIYVKKYNPEHILSEEDQFGIYDNNDLISFDRGQLQFFLSKNISKRLQRHKYNYCDFYLDLDKRNKQYVENKISIIIKIINIFLTNTFDERNKYYVYLNENDVYIFFNNTFDHAIDLLYLGNYELHDLMNYMNLRISSDREVNIRRVKNELHKKRNGEKFFPIF
jgi:hypothetical protein